MLKVCILEVKHSRQKEEGFFIPDPNRKPLALYGREQRIYIHLLELN